VVLKTLLKNLKNDLKSKKNIIMVVLNGLVLLVLLLLGTMGITLMESE
jgi:hypothetical protein